MLVIFLRNRLDYRELFEFLEEICSILTEELSLGNNAVDRQIVAIYLLLCLYLKQPTNLRQQIRMTSENIICMRNLLKDDSVINRDDLKYTIGQFYSLNAIKFVQSNIIYGPSLVTKKNVIQTYKNRHSTRRTNRNIESSNEGTSKDRTPEQAITDNLKYEISPTLDQMESLLSTYIEVRKSVGITANYNLQDLFIPESINQFMADANSDASKNNELTSVVTRLNRLFSHFF